MIKLKSLLLELNNPNSGKFIVYHGTNCRFKKFDLNRSTQGIIWFTSEKQKIIDNDTGGMSNKYLITAEITLNNPADWNKYHKYSIGELIRDGYDGIVLPEDDNYKIVDYVIFSPSQIKILKVELTKKQLNESEYTNHFRGWISPNGEEFNTNDGGTHDSHANRLLSKIYPNWNWESLKAFQHQGVIYADLALQYKGWIRVVDNGIYSIYKMTPQIKSILIELLSELPPSHVVYLDIEVGRRITHSTAKGVLEFLND